MGLQKNTKVHWAFDKPVEVVNVTANVTEVRPFVVAAILRDVDLGEEGFKSFVQF